MCITKIKCIKKTKIKTKCMTWWCAFESTMYLIDFTCHHILIVDVLFGAERMLIEVLLKFTIQ